MSVLDRVLDRLNPEQRQAVVSASPRILVIAGAGSGKTAVLTTRIAYLQSHERVGTSNMLALTFTRLAAAEMKERVGRLLGEEQAKKLTAGTFHSFCARILRRCGEPYGLGPDFSIYGQEDRDAILGEVIADLRLASRVRASEIDPWRPTNDPYQQQVINEYRSRLRRNNATDLDGLLQLTAQALQTRPGMAHELRERFLYVFVDEYQDTDEVQDAILEALNPRNLFVVGDPSQAIYGWRGAKVENILTFEERHQGVEVIRLERNYRSTSEILGLANKVIAAAKHKSPLQLWTDKQGDSPELLHSPRDVDETIDIGSRFKRDTETQWSDVAILCRTNAQVDLFETALKQAGIPTYLVSPRSDALNAYDVRRVIDYMAWFANPRDGRAFRRIVNWPTRRLTDLRLLETEHTALTSGADSLEALIAASGIREEGDPPVEGWASAASLWTWVLEHLGLRYAYETQWLRNRIDELDRATEAIERWEKRQETLGEPVSPQAFLTWLRVRDIQERMVQERAEGVNILTVHAAKGLEWEHVVVPGCNQDVFPTRRGDPEEERRLFYVAVTRAKQTLWLSYSDERTGFNGQVRPVKPSPYLNLQEGVA